MEFIRKDIEINKFTFNTYKSVIERKIDNLESFHLSKNSFEYTDPTYTLITSVKINEDSVFQKTIHYSPETCIEIAIESLEKDIRSLKFLVDNNEYDRGFLLNQAAIKKTLISGGVEPDYDDSFSKKIRKQVRKSDNVVGSFRNIMESIK